MSYTGEVTSADVDPEEFPDGLMCAYCDRHLDSGNAMLVDVTDEPNTPKWERADEDGPRVRLYVCVHCIAENKHEG